MIGLMKIKKNNDNTIRLDFKTWLFLFLTRAVKIKHIPVREEKVKKRINIENSNINEIYIFKDYAEYRNFFLMYLNDIDDEIIDLAIYTKGRNGQIVALKALCEHIIVKMQVNDFYNSITPEQIKEIHAKGKLTSLEAVQWWESLNLCIVDMNFSRYNRCKYFNDNCHECLRETASHQLEYDKDNFLLNDSRNQESEFTRKLVSYNKYQ